MLDLKLGSLDRVKDYEDTKAKKPLDYVKDYEDFDELEADKVTVYIMFAFREYSIKFSIPLNKMSFSEEDVHYTVPLSQITAFKTDQIVVSEDAIVHLVTKEKMASILNYLGDKQKGTDPIANISVNRLNTIYSDKFGSYIRNAQSRYDYITKLHEVSDTGNSISDSGRSR